VSRSGSTPAISSSVQVETKEQWLKKGKIFLGKGQYNEAKAAFEHVIQLDSRHAEAYYWRGTLYQDLEQFQKALADFDRALLLDPDLTEAQEAREEANRALC